MRRRPLVLSLLLALALAAPSAGIDCGRLPTGKNPEPAELSEAIATLSASNNVPTEIIKGIAWQESGCQQWRADGTFVYNKTDCGLGMMQLTGATARQFDVERLKDDWRYNLECGVKVLTEKWAMAQRQGLVPADPSARRVLENWHYAVAFYWGKREESYLRKIFGHIEKRPGKLQQLLRAGVKVTIASEAIPGFSFGDKFLAKEGDVFVDKEGKEHAAPTHLGTVGDEQTLAALDAWLTRARKAVEQGKAKRALGYLKKIGETGYDTSHAAEAEQLTAQLEARGREALAAAQAKAVGGDVPAAKRELKKLVREYEGLKVAEEAAAALAGLDG